MATRTSDWNTSIINEFRANQGKVGGYFAGRTLLLLHHKGAKTGFERDHRDPAGGLLLVFPERWVVRSLPGVDLVPLGGIRDSGLDLEGLGPHLHPGPRVGLEVVEPVRVRR